MFTVGRLLLDVKRELPEKTDVVVLPFRCYNGDRPAPYKPIPMPLTFIPSPNIAEVPNCTILDTISSGAATYIVIKCDHMSEISDQTRTTLAATAQTISKAHGREFSVGMPFFDMPKYRDINRWFFLRLLEGLRDRERCVVVVENGWETVTKLLQGVVGELNASVVVEMERKPFSLPPPPLFFPPMEPVSKRPRERSPSPPSQSILRSLLKLPKIAVSPSKGNTITLPEEDIMCIICYEINPDVVTSSCCGGIICQACLPGIQVCPVCRRPTLFQPSPMVRKLVNNLTVRCLCGQELAWEALKVHHITCVRQRTGCPAQECQKLKLDQESLKEHLREVHKKEILLALQRLLPK